MSGIQRLPAIAAYDLPGAGELPASRADWTPDSARMALLIHDLQLYFLAAYGEGAAPARQMLARVAAIAAQCRARGVPVFYTAQRGDQDPRDRGLQADLWGPGMQAIPAHEDIHPDVAPQPGDIVLVKHRYSAFQRSNLAALLRARGRDQLAICGVYAHIGCMMTAAEAFQRDVRPFFVADALGDFSRAHHDAALLQVARSCGVVLGADRLMESLR